MPAALRGDARDLPMLAGHTPDDIIDLQGRQAHEQVEELRLAYVAWTRARHRLAVSAGAGRPPEDRARPVAVRRRHPRGDGGVGRRARAWFDMPPKGAINPYAGGSLDLPWPISHRTAEVDRRIAAADLVRAAATTRCSTTCCCSSRCSSGTTRSSGCSRRPRRDRSPETEVPMPTSLSATALARLRDDPEAFAADLARPMPRQPSSAARFGTRFHAWVEARFGQQQLLDPDDLPGRADAGIDDESELLELVMRVRVRTVRRPGAARIEAPFALVLAGQVVRGRIDAVYHEDDGSYLVVDWKTNRTESADPLQLAIYRTRLGRAARRTARAGAGGVLLRPLRPPGRAGRAARAGRAGAPAGGVRRQASSAQRDPSRAGRARSAPAAPDVPPSRPASPPVGRRCPGRAPPVAIGCTPAGVRQVTVRRRVTARSLRSDRARLGPAAPRSRPNASRRRCRPIVTRPQPQPSPGRTSLRPGPAHAPRRSTSSARRAHPRDSRSGRPRVATASPSRSRGPAATRRRGRPGSVGQEPVRSPSGSAGDPPERPASR